MLDPVWTAAYVTRNHGMMVFDTLYGHGRRRIRSQPQMADGHRIEDDGKTWLITLRDGLAWHDGQKVLARDCIASIRRWGARDSFGQTLMAVTDALDAPDDRTIRFRLKRPFPLLPAALGKAGSNVCAMMPERLANTDPFKQVSEMIGSGPFRYIAKEHVAGSLIVYERNAAYVPRPSGTPSFIAGPKIVHVDRVEWHVLPDPTTAVGAMQAGEFRLVGSADVRSAAAVAQAQNLTVPAPTPLGFLGGLRFNRLQPPFNNAALRRALLGAVNQEDFMIAAAGTDQQNWHTPVGMFCPQSPMASMAGMEVLTGPRDLAAVKRAVAASGYAGEKAVVPVPTDFPNLRALADVGVDMMQKAGLNVEASYTDWGSMLQTLPKTDPVEQGGWSAFHTYWSGLDQFDPAVHVWIRGNGRAATRGWPDSPKLEALRDAWLAAGDLADAEAHRRGYPAPGVRRRAVYSAGPNSADLDVSAEHYRRAAGLRIVLERAEGVTPCTPGCIANRLKPPRLSSWPGLTQPSTRSAAGEDGRLITRSSSATWPGHDEGRTVPAVFSSVVVDFLQRTMNGPSDRSLPRRGVLSGLAITGAAMATGLAAPSPTDQVAVRQDTARLPPSRLALLEETIGEMQRRSKRDPADPKGWRVNALAHTRRMLDSIERRPQPGAWMLVVPTLASCLPRRNRVEAARSLGRSDAGSAVLELEQ